MYAAFIIVSIYTLGLTFFLIRIWKLCLQRCEIETLILDKTDLTADNQTQAKYPFISIIVPMRNEEINVETCVECVVSQDYPEFELIVIDDESQDRTLDILRDLEARYDNLRIIEGDKMPEGWIGKSWALHQAAKEAKGEIILFLDADSKFKPNLLRVTTAYMQIKDLDMLSIWPFQETVTFWERIIQPMIFTLIRIINPVEKVNDPQSLYTAASGQFIMIKRGVYESVGGHAAIRDKMIEDDAISKAVKTAGYRLGIDFASERLINARMYRNLSEIWEGYTKLLYTRTHNTFASTTIGVLQIASWGIFPLLIFLASLALILTGAGLFGYLILIESVWALALTGYLAFKISDMYRIPAYYALLFPLWTFMMIALILDSAYKVLSGKGVEWKGRKYTKV